MGVEASCLAPSAVGVCSEKTAGHGVCRGAGCFTTDPSHARPGGVRNIGIKDSTARGGNRIPNVSMGGRALPGGSWNATELPMFPPADALATSCYCTASANVQLEEHYGTVEEAIHVARRYVEEGDTQRAFNTYSVALELDGESAQLCDEFGQFLLSHGELEGAEYLFNCAVALDPQSPEYCYKRGVVLQQRAQPMKAAESFTKALQNDPKFIGALFNLGVVHKELGDFTSASDDFRKVLQLNPKSCSALALLGESLAELGDIDGAVRSLEEALRIDPTSRSAQKDLRQLRQSAAKPAHPAAIPC